MHATRETRLLTVPEVAKLLNISRATAYRRIRDGTIPALRIGDEFGPLRVPEDKLTEWLYSARREYA